MLGGPLPLFRLVLVYIPDLAGPTRLGSVGLDFLGGTAASLTALGLRALTMASHWPLLLLWNCVFCVCSSYAMR
jgi:hypothetical protein